MECSVGAADPALVAKPFKHICLNAAFKELNYVSMIEQRTSDLLYSKIHIC